MTMLVTITCTACRVPFQLNFLLARQIGFNPFDSPWRGRTVKQPHGPGPKVMWHAVSASLTQRTPPVHGMKGVSGERPSGTSPGRLSPAASKFKAVRPLQGNCTAKNQQIFEPDEIAAQRSISSSMCSRRRAPRRLVNRSCFQFLPPSGPWPFPSHDANRPCEKTDICRCSHDVFPCSVRAAADDFFLVTRHRRYIRGSCGFQVSRRPMVDMHNRRRNLRTGRLVAH